MSEDLSYFLHKFATWGSDLLLSAGLLYAYVTNLHEMVNLLAPVGVPLILGLRALAAFEEYKLRRQLRRNAEEMGRRMGNNENA